MEDCERQLTANMLNVVAALAMRSIRNTGIPKSVFCHYEVADLEMIIGMFMF